MPMELRPTPRLHTSTSTAPPPLHTPSVVPAAAAGTTSPVPAARPGTGGATALTPPPEVIEVDPSNRTTWPSVDAIQFSR